ncbi:MAG: galactose ABC transporter substrate-binding protein [Clostridiales bacterium]|jgi:methyl-galactoside transport system substrate-binding protein|nr:galactose ABC transporter substrate-binding protein [Clostridiales bacterium]
MKKILALVLTSVMAVTALTACTTTPPEAAPTEAAATEAAPTEAAPTEAAPDTEDSADPVAGEPVTYNVGVSIYKFDDNFMTLYRQEIESYFKSLETDTVKYNVTIVDGKGDMAEQTNQVDTFIAQGVDVLVMNLVQSSSAATITQKAKDAGIPVVYINREPSEDDMLAWENICYVGADARQSGTFQGEIVRDLDTKGDADGDGVVRYVMIMGDPENIDAQHRTNFSIKALEDAGIEVEKLFEQRGDWEQAKGQELAATALAQFGDKVDVIFCNNDGMALGAYQAIVAAGRTVNEDIYLLGVDALEECKEMIANGEMTGTVLNDHIGQSHTAVDAAIKYINGETNATYLWVDYQKVTK